MWADGGGMECGLMGGGNGVWADGGWEWSVGLMGWEWSVG